MQKAVSVCYLESYAQTNYEFNTQHRLKSDGNDVMMCLSHTLYMDLRGGDLQQYTASSQGLAVISLKYRANNFFLQYVQTSLLCIVIVKLLVMVLSSCF